MNVTVLEWIVTLGITTAVLTFDVVTIARRPHEPTMRRCALALSAYIGLAVVFAVWMWVLHGQQFGLQFVAGWLTEYSLSIDNLFMFIVIMANFQVPKTYQLQALFFGIVIALFFRGILIVLGAAAIQQFAWVFYLFGGFLVYTAMRVAREGGHHPKVQENAVIRFARRRLNVTDGWDGMRLWVRRGAKPAVTPMFIVIVALGATDLVFALDSIPAIYGLTRQPFLVFAANVFALMGMRQLYFLVGGLLERLVYLSKGLAFILLFIGVKLILHAMHANELPFVNGGHHIAVPTISTSLSLAVIVVTLTATAVASLCARRVQRTDFPARASTGLRD